MNHGVEVYPLQNAQIIHLDINFHGVLLRL